jgi:hypothetical protein
VIIRCLSGHARIMLSGSDISGRAHLAMDAAFASLERRTSRVRAR